eukprot:14667088-Ditylum_brightwellii.AAC.1
MTMSNAEKHHALCTNFGSTLDLFASEKDNSSVDNHAALCIFFVLSNWRNVKYKTEEGEYKDTVVNDCDKWLVFGDTMSRGKKNDHIFHNARFTYIIKIYDMEQENEGKGNIPTNIIHTDNFPTQYKCRQNFLEVAKSCNTRKTTVVHKCSQKYGFKGSCNAAGKLVKQSIECLKLKGK